MRPIVAPWKLRNTEMANSWETDYVYHHGITTTEWKELEAQSVANAYLKGDMLVVNGRFVCLHGHRFNETCTVTKHGKAIRVCPWCLTNQWLVYSQEEVCVHSISYDKQCNECWRWV